MPELQSPQLQSHADNFSPQLRLFICIAAKVATLHALAGRYTQRLSTADVDEEDAATSSAQRQLDAQQLVSNRLMQHTIQHATRWLQILCTHLDVDLANLPDDPDVRTKLDEAVDLESDGEWEVASELVLVSVVMMCSEEEEIREQAQTRERFEKAEREGKLDVPPEEDDDHTPPLDYTALSRTLVMRTSSVLGIEESVVEGAEKAIAQFLYFEMESKAKEKERKQKEKEGKVWDEATQDWVQRTAETGKLRRWAAAGAGFVVGGVAIGLTGGLAAPALAPLLAGTLGIAAFGGASGAVLIGTLLGLGGGGLAGYRTHRRMQGLEQVSFEPIVEADAPQIPSLIATVVASGFLLDERDSIDPWRPTFEASRSDAYALKADPKAFLQAGQALQSFVRTKLISMGGTEVIKRTALASIYAGVALPLTIYNTTTMLLDSDFTRCRDKAKKAGVLLAEILEKQVQGKRPVVLIGYGPGATMIFHCLLHLHLRELGHLVYSATLISLPDSPSPAKWAAARSVVAHELVNTYSTNDWVLALNARLYTVNNRIGGLQPVLVSGVRDVDCSDLIPGHLEIRDKIGAILKRIEDDRRGKIRDDASEKGEGGVREDVAPAAQLESEPERLRVEVGDVAGKQELADGVEKMKLAEEAAVVAEKKNAAS